MTITTESKALPKSLHTVTAIVQVAKYALMLDEMSNADAVQNAISVLGYAGATDPHGLVAKALKVLEA